MKNYQKRKFASQLTDDNRANVDILQARLAANDYEIITASDGETGLAMARDRLPDLILLGIMMPKMDGIEVCRHLRADSSLPDGSLLAYVADVSDKGVPAARVMAALSTRIRSEARSQYEIDTLLETVNNRLHSLTAEEGFFATIVLARYWPDSGKMQLTLAGHLQPLWIVESGIGNCPQIKGISLGITPDVRYEKKEILLSPGESILLFSDGVIEAENEDNELFGNERLVDFIKDAKGPPWGSGLLDFISNWRGNSSASDDLTILEIWRDSE